MKKPLPFSAELPPATPHQMPEALYIHLLEIVAHAIRSQSDVMTFNLEHLSHPGDQGLVDLGSWKITVARTS